MKTEIITTKTFSHTFKIDGQRKGEIKAMIQDGKLVDFYCRSSNRSCAAVFNIAGTIAFLMENEDSTYDVWNAIKREILKKGGK